MRSMKDGQRQRQLRLLLVMEVAATVATSISGLISHALVATEFAGNSSWTQGQLDETQLHGLCVFES